MRAQRSAERWKKAYDKLKVQLKVLRGDLDHFEELKARSTQLLAENERITTELATIKSLFAEFHTHRDTMQEMYEDLLSQKEAEHQAEILTLQTLLDAHGEEISSFQQQRESLQAEIERLTQEVRNRRSHSQTISSLAQTAKFMRRELSISSSGVPQGVLSAAMDRYASTRPQEKTEKFIRRIFRDVLIACPHPKDDGLPAPAPASVSDPEFQECSST